MNGLEGLEDLRAALRGSLLLPGEGPFAKRVSEVWAVSGASPKLTEPAFIVQPRGTSDVAAALKWAHQRGLPVAVRCGGHGGGNPSCVAGGVMVDMSQMRSVYVDPAARTAVVDGGCMAKDVDSETAPYGLAAPVGICPTVGVGGLALNGGLSLLSRSYGAVCDNILEAQLVLADGTVVTASEESDPELLWAVRGGGSALGVATKLKLRLYDVSDLFCGSMVLVDDAEHKNYRAVLRFIRDTVLPNPDVGFNVLRALDPNAGPVLVLMVALPGEGTREEKEAIVKPLRDLGPVHDSVGKATWRETQNTQGPPLDALKQAFPTHYEVWSGGHVDAEQFTEGLMDAWVEQTCDALPVPECTLGVSFFELMGGQMKNSPGPVGMRSDIQWVCMTGYADPAHTDVARAYAERLRARLAPFSTPTTSGYINMVDMAEVKSLTREEAAAFVGGAENLARLAAVKARVDPNNVFRHTPLSVVLAAGGAVPEE
ncbi:hypothetical protein ABPG77_005620 [Micractinium sp. CCAP 211/92]